jgi:hypothetical protein
MNDAFLPIDELVAEWLDRAGVAMPPVDVRQVARRLQLKVVCDDRQSGRARMVRMGCPGSDSGVSIFVRREARGERLQWSIAHEIGEAFAAEAFGRLDWDARGAAPGLRERVANQIANRLLLPTAWFRRDLESCQRDLFPLKAIYRTASYELIARRLLDFPPYSITAIFDQGELTRRMGNLPSRLPPLMACESAAQREAFRSGECADCSGGRFSCRAWAIHERDWKREIIRTEYLECEG